MSTGRAPDVELGDVSWRIDSAAYERASSPTGYVARYVPYITAAVVADLLDSWVGAQNWRDSYEMFQLGAEMVAWCHIEVRVDDEWVRKTDLGVMPAANPGSGSGDGLREKGLISDAFKRCGTLKWGAGRNVYALPTLWAAVTVRNSDLKKPTAPPGIEDDLVRQLRSRGHTVDRVAVDSAEDTSTTVEPGHGGGAVADVEPTVGTLNCPACGGSVDDLRTQHSADTKSPAFRCTNSTCEGGSEKKTGGRWPWASWDTNWFAPTPTAAAKRLVVDRATELGVTDPVAVARDAWKQGAATVGLGPDDPMDAFTVGAVTEWALDAVAEQLTLTKTTFAAVADET